MRNLKVLGLALLVVFSMSAVMASAAQATPETTTLTTTAGGAGPVTLTAEQQAGGEQVFAVNTGNIKCPSIQIPSTIVSLPAETIEVHPEYGQTTKCKAFGFNATITTTGCNLIHITTGKQEKITGQITVLCSGANKITVTNIGTNCVVTVGSQTVPGDAEFVNTPNAAEPTKDDLDLIANLAGIKYTEAGTECANPGITSENGTYKGNTTVKGFQVQVGILVD